MKTSKVILSIAAMWMANAVSANECEGKITNQDYHSITRGSSIICMHTFICLNSDPSPEGDGGFFHHHVCNVLE